MRTYGFLTLFCITLFAGCDLFVLKPAPPKQAQNAAAPSLPGSTGILPPGDLHEMAAPVAGQPGTAPGANPAAPATTQEVAGVGSGLKGRSLDDPNNVGMIVAPARAYFSAKERIAYDYAKHALDLYTAGEGEGNGPASHDEYMQKVIQANNIALPVLPPGHRYVFDPAKQELMVEKPAKKQ